MNKQNLGPRKPCGRALAAAIVLLAFGGPALATRVEFALATVNVIASDSGFVRVLLDPGDISVLDGELVTSAFLELPLPNRVPVTDLDIVVYAVGSPWVGASPTWDTPWVQRGGDLDATYAHTVTLQGGREAGLLRIDVTQMVRDMADGLAGKRGFLLTVPRARREGFDAADVAALGPLTSGRLMVTYRAISELGYDQGSMSIRR